MRESTGLAAPIEGTPQRRSLAAHLQVMHTTACFGGVINIVAEIVAFDGGKNLAMP